jgi:hypothetical protein
MRDMDETRVRQELFELVRDVDVAPGLERRTIRRARRQRVLNATLSVVLAVGLVAGAAIGASSVLSTDRAPTIGGDDETPTPPATVRFQGIWPETDATGLADTQAQVDDGHQPLRTDPVGTAQLLAVNVLGWPPGEFGTDAVDVRGDRATVYVVNPTFGDPVPPITIELAQLGRTGPNGVWSVTDVSSPLIQLDPIAVLDDGSVTASGRMADTLLDPTLDADSWAPTGINVEVVTGPSPDSAVTGETLPIAETWQWTAPPVNNPAVLWIEVVDDRGRALGGTAISLLSTALQPVPSPTPSASVSEPSPVAPQDVDTTGVPDATAATAEEIYAGVLNLDFELLASLLDPNTFVHNADDGSNPIPGWRDDPTVLDAIPAILTLPPAAPLEIEGYGTLYLWPYLVDSDFANLTDRERRDLASLGFAVRDIDVMVEQDHYLGPRLAIDADGVWRNYITGGE